jgi:hypothetical protein
MKDEFDVTMNERLVREFPEFTDKLGVERQWYGGDSEPGSTVIYETLFSPWLLAAVHAQQEDSVKRGLAFVESVLREGDARAAELMRVAILEVLLVDRTVWRRAKDGMGEFTLRQAHAVEAPID